MVFSSLQRFPLPSPTLSVGMGSPVFEQSGTPYRRVSPNRRILQMKTVSFPVFDFPDGLLILKEATLLNERYFNFESTS